MTDTEPLHSILHTHSKCVKKSGPVAESGGEDMLRTPTHRGSSLQIPHLRVTRQQGALSICLSYFRVTKPFSCAAFHSARNYQTQRRKRGKKNAAAANYCCDELYLVDRRTHKNKERDRYCTAREP